MMGTSVAPRMTVVQIRFGAMAKASTKGAVEPMKLRTISALLTIRPIGRITMLITAMTVKARKGQLMALAGP